MPYLLGDEIDDTTNSAASVAGRCGGLWAVVSYETVGLRRISHRLLRSGLPRKA